MLTKKALTIFIVVSLVVYAVAPLNYPDYPPAGLATHVLFALVQPLVLFLLLFVGCLAVISPKAVAPLRVVSLKVICIATYLIVPTAFTLALTNSSGLWWSWPTLATLWCLVALVYAHTYETIGNSNALILGAGASVLMAGLWEVAYQISLYYIHPYYHNNNTIRAVYFMLSFVVSGGVVVAALTIYHRLWRFTNLVKWALLGAAAVFGIWLLIGMPLQRTIASDGVTWIALPANHLAATLYRASKALLVLAIAGVYMHAGYKVLNGRRVRLRN